ncbi:zinc finger, CCHC-type containing protein [Tanacetum coccineum]
MASIVGFKSKFFYDHVSFHLKCEIDRAFGGKLRNKNADESWEIIENLALYDHEGWDDTKEFVKLVKDITVPQGITKTPDRRLLELEDQYNFLLKGSRPAPPSSSTHNRQAYVNAAYSSSHPKNQNESPTLNSFAFRERTGPAPQPQALGTNFEARVRNYMAAHTERMERFENIIFKQREEINGRMTEMFELLKELTTNKTPEKNEEEENNNTDETPNNTKMPIETEMPVRKAEAMNGAEKESKENIEVAEHVFPVDFVILDIKENEKRPFILGTPFLTTAKATIKFNTGTITLRSGKSKVSSYRISDSSCMTSKGVKNDIEPIAPIMTINRLVLEWEERIRIHLEKDMKFNKWRSNNLKNKQPAPIKVERGMDDEGEVTSFAFGIHLEELHVTWAHLEKKRTRLRTYTNITQDNVLSSWRRRHQYNVMPSQRRPRRLHWISRRLDPLSLMSNVSPQQYSSQSSTTPSSTHVPPVTYQPHIAGHIARNCTQPKRPHNSDYFKDKILLMQAQENGVVLDEEQLLFLASGYDTAVDEDVDEPPV